MRTVHEVSELTGVSVRTLHHYDAIGLLKPTRVTDAGYRLYDESALRRLQSILLFRELQFPLREIKAILDDPRFDPAEALARQLTLLEMKKRHTEELIAHVRTLQEQGGMSMDFSAFGAQDIERYKDEARERWGDTAAYGAYEQKEKTRTAQDDADDAREMTALFAAFGELRGLSPADAAVQERVEALQAFITKRYYPCTDEILSCLGQMYTGDERFRENIDAAGGDGTAAFVAEAIRIRCGK